MSTCSPAANPSAAATSAVAATTLKTLSWTRNPHGQLRALARHGFVYSLAGPTRYGEGWSAFLERNVGGEYRGIEITKTAKSDMDAMRICQRDLTTRTDWRWARVVGPDDAERITEARHTIACTHPESGTDGCWIFSGSDHRVPGTSLSPVFPDLGELFTWMGTHGWRSSTTYLCVARIQPEPGPVSATGTGRRGGALGFSHPQDDPPGLYPSIDL